MTILAQLRQVAHRLYYYVRILFLTRVSEMVKSKMTSKGQVTIPIEVRKRLGLRTGDELEFTEENGLYHLRKHLPPTPLKKYRGYLKHLEKRDADELVNEMRGQ